MVVSLAVVWFVRNEEYTIVFISRYHTTLHLSESRIQSRPSHIILNQLPHLPFS